MSAPSAFPAERQVLVWDAPVRVFHWLMVLCFTGAYLTSESEIWRLVHVTLGYTMVGLVAFRMVWGILGTRYARFGEFVRSPYRVAHYLRGLAQGQPAHFLGHNPLGALSILAVLALALGIGASGWAGYNELAGEWVAELHEGIANTMLLVIGVHVAGVVLSSRMHKVNLARAMITGHKAGPVDEGIHSAWWSLAVLLLIAVGCFWWLQWRSVPV